MSPPSTTSHETQLPPERPSRRWDRRLWIALMFLPTVAGILFLGSGALGHSPGADVSLAFPLFAVVWVAICAAYVAMSAPPGVSTGSCIARALLAWIFVTIPNAGLALIMIRLSGGRGWMGP